MYKKLSVTKIFIILVTLTLLIVSTREFYLLFKNYNQPPSRNYIILTGIVPGLLILVAAAFIFSLLRIKKINTELRKKSTDVQKFFGLVNTAPDATFILNEESEIVMSNIQVKNLFGYSTNELIGKKGDLFISTAMEFNFPLR